MQEYSFSELKTSRFLTGATRYTKASYPVIYGRYSEITTPSHRFIINPSGSIRMIFGKSKNWPHPAEWLKRNIASGWLYYSTGSYNDIFDLIGEYYLPCLPYKTNAIRGGNPFAYKEVKEAFAAMERLALFAEKESLGAKSNMAGFLKGVAKNRQEVLEMKKMEFRKILRTDISVLPPDTRHVDYDVIPVVIADGCLYRCPFCCVKTGMPFKERSLDEINRQIEELIAYIGDDIINYNSLFLANHDALNAGEEKILYAAKMAFERFGFAESIIRDPALFLFASPDSMLMAPEKLFKELNSSGYNIFINVGLESFDDITLIKLGKPVSSKKVVAAYERMQEINSSYGKIEVTANFVIGTDWDETHIPATLDVLGKSKGHIKGTAYFSPLNTACDRMAIRSTFVRIKRFCPVPSYLYLIQGL